MKLPPVIICDDYPAWAQLAATAWRIAESKIEYPSAPGWKPQMCCMPGSGNIWLWDSCFIPFYARYGGGFVPMMHSLDNLYRMQREDGFIAMAYEIASETPAYGDRINPPLLAWTEWGYWKFSGDDSRIHTVLPRLVKLFDWIKTNRTRKSGLYWFEDSGSSGMDNSPRSGYHAEHLDGSDVCHVDLIAQQALSAKCIVEMARHLGDSALAERFENAHAEITTLLNRYHWDPRSGFYYDVFHRSSPNDLHNFLNHKTVASFWPMMAECCREDQVDALVRHLTNPDEFWTKHPVASLSKDDPNFDPAGAYWLGGVWAPINYMLVQALKKYGHGELARKLAMKHLTAMQAVYESSEYSGIWEAYAPEAYLPATNKPVMNGNSRVLSVLNADTIVKADFVGWSGLGPIAMLIEEVLGLDFDARSGEVHWNVRLPGRHGIERLAFGGGNVSLLLSNATNGVRRLIVESDSSFKLRLTDEESKSTEYLITPGSHTWEI